MVSWISLKQDHGLLDDAHGTVLCIDQRQVVCCRKELALCGRITPNTKPREKVMQKELTIDVDERVYDQLQRIGGPEDISQFIESLIIPPLADADLESGYQQMAEDRTREAEALEWAEAMIGDTDATR